MKSVRKIIAAMIMVVLVAGLCACGKASIGSSDLTGKETTAVATAAETVKETTKAAENVKTETETKADEKVSVETETSEKAPEKETKPAEKPSEKETQAPTKVPEKETQTPAKPAETETTTEETQPETEAVCRVTYTVNGGGSAGVFYSGTMEFTGSVSVYNLLTRTGVSISGSSSYVSAINGLREKEHGPMSGWLYSVNGSTPMVPCGSYYLKDGDSVYWWYQYDE